MLGKTNLYKQIQMGKKIGEITVYVRDYLKFYENFLCLEGLYFHLNVMTQLYTIHKETNQVVRLWLNENNYDVVLNFSQFILRQN